MISKIPITLQPTSPIAITMLSTPIYGSMGVNSESMQQMSQTGLSRSSMSPANPNYGIVLELYSFLPYGKKLYNSNTIRNNTYITFITFLSRDKKVAVVLPAK